MSGLPPYQRLPAVWPRGELVEAAVELVEGKRVMRRKLASQDPDVLALYERFVIVRQGLRDFIREVVTDGPQEWFVLACEAEVLVDRAQQSIEGLR